MDVCNCLDQRRVQEFFQEGAKLFVLTSASYAPHESFFTRDRIILFRFPLWSYLEGPYTPPPSLINSIRGICPLCPTALHASGLAQDI